MRQGTGSNTEQVRQVIKQHGPISARQIQEALPDLRKAQIKNALCHLIRMEHVTSAEPGCPIGRGRPGKSYVLTDTAQDEMESYEMEAQAGQQTYSYGLAMTQTEKVEFLQFLCRVTRQRYHLRCLASVLSDYGARAPRVCADQSADMPALPTSEKAHFLRLLYRKATHKTSRLRLSAILYDYGVDL